MFFIAVFFRKESTSASAGPNDVHSHGRHLPTSKKPEDYHGGHRVAAGQLGGHAAG